LNSVIPVDRAIIKHILPYPDCETMRVWRRGT